MDITRISNAAALCGTAYLDWDQIASSIFWLFALEGKSVIMAAPPDGGSFFSSLVNELFSGGLGLSDVYSCPPLQLVFF